MDLDFRRADHLPETDGGGPADPYRLPRQRRGTTPQMHGRYPTTTCSRRPIIGTR